MIYNRAFRFSSLFLCTFIVHVYLSIIHNMFVYYCIHSSFIYYIVVTSTIFFLCLFLFRLYTHNVTTSILRCTFIVHARAKECWTGHWQFTYMIIIVYIIIVYVDCSMIIVVIDREHTFKWRWRQRHGINNE